MVAVQAFDSAARPILHHVPGDDLILRVTVQADETLSDWVLGVGIDSPTGQQVFGTNTQLLGTKLEPLTGRATFDVRLSGLLLGEGDYHLHGALAQWDGPTFNQLSEAASISVEGTGRSIGPVGVTGIDAVATREPAAVELG